MRSWLLAAILAGCASPTADYAVSHQRDEAPAWTIPYGREPWLAQPGTQIAVDRVRHAIRDLRVEDPAFTASYGEHGLAFAPRGTAALALATARVAIGDRSLEPSGGWSILGNTAQRRWGEIVEHHAVTADGVEIAWVLREPVAGPLTVELAADGLAYAGRTPGGDHFADAAGVARVRIGAAALVDARGRRWPIEPAYDAGALRWRVPAEVLAAAAFPVALDPMIGPELGSDSPVTGNTPETGDAALAWNGTEWLAVWADPLRQAVHGTRLSSTGAILDPAGIVIDEGSTGVPQVPRVASNGAEFLVAWAYEEMGATGVVGQHITTTGQLLDVPLVITTNTQNTGDGEGVALASNGTDYTAVWAAPDAVYATQISGSGVGGALFVAPGATVGRPAIAFNGTKYLVVWSDGGSVNGVQLDPAGPIGSPFAISATLTFEPDVASNGTDYLVTALDGPGPATVYGARVSGAGAVLDASPFAIASGATDAPRVASALGTYLVTWPGTGCEAARVASTGTVTDTTPLALGAGTGCIVAASAGGYLAAWDGAAGISGALVSTAGVVSPSARISTLGTNTQTAPALATNGNEYLFAWSDSRANGELVATRVSATGAILDLDGIVVATAMPGMSAPSVGANATDFLVTWSAQATATTDAIYGAGVSATGTADAAPFVVGQSVISQTSGLASQPSSPVVAGIGANFLVAWSDTRCASSAPGTVPCQDPDQPGVYASVVSAGVALNPTGVAIATGADFARIACPSSLATNGTEYLLAWSAPGNGVFATPVTATGVRKGGDIELEIGAVDASAASDDTDFFVVWQGAAGPTGARISAAGNDLDPTGIPIGSVVATGASRVAFDGNAYLVVSGDGQIGGTHILPTGELFDAFAISTVGTAPSVSAHEGMPALVAYESRGRVTARLITEVCGDGALDPGEACDDGNTRDGDGCSTSCAVEAGFTCVGQPSSCTPTNQVECGGITCDPNATCINTLTGAQQCFCNTGFTGDGSTCETDDGGAAGCSCSAKRGLPLDLPLILAMLAIPGWRRRRARRRSRR